MASETPRDLPNLQLLTLAKLVEVTGLSEVTIWRLRRTDASFPQAIQLSPRRIGFTAVSVNDWVASRLAATRGER